MEGRRGTRQGNKTRKERHKNKKRKLLMERTRISSKANGEGRKSVKYNQKEE
jgi:hypothetical protein